MESNIYKPSLIYIKALAQSVGNLTLSDDVNWNTSRSLLYYIKVVTASTDWNLTLYPDANFNDAGLFPSMILVLNRNGNMSLELMMPYWDTTNLKKVYFNFVDNAGANTADIYITGVQAR